MRNYIALSNKILMGLFVIKKRLLLSALFLLNVGMSTDALSSRISQGDINRVFEVVRNIKNDDFYRDNSFPCGADAEDCDYGDVRYQLTRLENQGDVLDWITNDVRNHKFSSLNSLNELEGIFRGLLN